jgi:hypothetical protein
VTRSLASPRLVLPVEESAILRERLLSEIAGLTSPESATSRARAALAAKNTLTGTDAKALEDAFEEKMAGFSPAQPELIRIRVGFISAVARPDLQRRISPPRSSPASERLLVIKASTVLS